MRHTLPILFTMIVLLSISCTKIDKKTNCNYVTITSTAPGCPGWGIVVNGIKYPSENIPAQFQQDGLGVCAEYELFLDARACACCGGTWADIKNMKLYLR